MSDKDILLIVEDDYDTMLSLVRALKNELGCIVEGAGNVEKALEFTTLHRPKVVVMDLSLDPIKGVESGFELLKEISKRDPSCRIIVLTGHNTTVHGIRAIGLGASSFLEKPADIGHVSALIKDGFSQSRLRREFDSLRRNSIDQISTFVVGHSDAMQNVVESITYAAQTNQPILIEGETGTGKGLCALAIHKFGTRKGNKFIRYQPNFSTFDLVNSDLFGHTKGSFTGATQKRTGLLEEVNGGTLFLDDIDELPLETQVGLLGVLQEKRFRPVGSNIEIESNFRIITATNQDVEELVNQKKLRKDFFHRIGHYRIYLPPLEERKEDIGDLSEHFLNKLTVNENLSVSFLSEEALKKLKNHSWPGNVRELEATIEGAAFRAHFNNRSFILPDDIKIQSLNNNGNKNVPNGFSECVEGFKLKIIRDALSKHRGNQVKAAQELKVDRSTLRRILARAEAQNI